MLCSGVKGIRYFEGTHYLHLQNISDENGQGVAYIGMRGQGIDVWRTGMAISRSRNKELQGRWRQ
jgi:hypothetical protein